MYLFVQFNGCYCAILETLYVDAQKSIVEKHKQKLNIAADSDVELPALCQTERLAGGILNQNIM